MVHDLVVVGAGGFGREVVWLASKLPNRWRVRGILDDGNALQGTMQQGVSVLGPIASYGSHADAKFVIAIGSPRARRAIRERMASIPDSNFAVLVDPQAHCLSDQKFGPGTIMCAGAVSTVNIAFGCHVILNINVSIGHDSVLGDYNTVAPLAAVSGNVVCGDGVEIGTGAAVRQGVAVGRGGMIGMGAVVLNDVPENQAVVGNPAKPLRALDAF